MDDSFGAQVNNVFIQNIDKDEKSNFDVMLRDKWLEAQKNGAFRYILNIQDFKILNGKYQFLAQLNIDRGSNRRSPERLTSMKQPFDDKHFNFTKLLPQEIITSVNSTEEDYTIAINNSPFEYCHSLLLPERNKKLPQIATKYSLLKAIELFSLSSSPYLRVCFNSLCAHASVNHLHWHLYYLNKRMLLEYIDLKEYAGPVQILDNYPAMGYCIQYSNFQSIDDFANWALLIISYLQNAEIAHNVYITRARLNIEEEYKNLRIYIWARKSVTCTKNTAAFNSAACELFGHLSIKSVEIYKNLSEEYVTHMFREATEETFYSIFTKIQNLIEEKLKENKSSI
ncbi:GDP-D-glucose phosphorylase 1 [Xylocopa sonorina]|uniref:GDP-D-glucose phosphorylase 1 n=1 Tax=Xylocopa sonorina TaxID=1818115 RepID=UPI00403AEAA7